MSILSSLKTLMQTACIFELIVALSPINAQATPTISWADIGPYSGQDTLQGLKHTYQAPLDELNKHDRIIRIEGLHHIQSLQDWNRMVKETKNIPTFESSMPATHQPTVAGRQMVARIATLSGRHYDLMVPVNMKLYSWYPGYAGDIYLPEETCSDCRNLNALPVGVGHLKPIALTMEKAQPIREKHLHVAENKQPL